MSTTQRKLATLLAADATGYSRLMGDDDKATVQTLTDYRQVFAERIAHHQGRVVDTAGDSVLAVFDSPVEAAGSYAIRRASRPSGGQDGDGSQEDRTSR